MGEKVPRWTYVVIFALLAIVVVLAARAFKNTESVTSAPPPEKTAGRDAETDRRVEELSGEVARLQKQNEENSSRVKDLESRLADTNKALAAAQQKLKTAQKQPERAAAAPARDRAPASTAPPAQPPARRAESVAYEVVRDSAIVEKPSSSAREVALVQRGTIVNVVGAQGDWLEVRSRYGKPPGYIRRDDVVLK